MKLQKIINYLVLLVGAIGFILWLVMNSSIGNIMKESGITDAADFTKPENADFFKDSVIPILNPLYALLIVVFVAVLLVTVISIINSLAKKPGSLKKVIVPIVAFVVILLAGYIFSTGDNVDLKPFLEKGEHYTEATSRNVGAGLISFYILIILAIASMVWSGIKKLFN